MNIHQQIVGAPVSRVDGPQKVTGHARYAYEQITDNVAYAFPVLSQIACGSIVSFETSVAHALPGVLAILTYENASRLQPKIDAELAVLQSNAVAYRGQYVALVIATSLETARQGAESVVVHYNEQLHVTELSTDDPHLFAPEQVNNGMFPSHTTEGDVELALATSPVVVDQTYRTPANHNNPMEPHATIAIWDNDDVTLYNSSQGAHQIQSSIAQVFGLEPERVHVISPYVGGGFGSKGTPRGHVVLTIMAAKEIGQPVKFALTRQQMFSTIGYRTPTIQRVRLGADKEGRLNAISHEVIEQTSTIQEFAEPVAVVTRMMYAAPNRITTHRLARLNVPTPWRMRAPGECPGMFALESAMDELALATGIDPIELRIRNEPTIDPESGKPFSSRHLVSCLREGAEHFGWYGRDPRPGVHKDGRWVVGTGVASSTYPTLRQPSSAIARVDGKRHYTVLIDATDLGTGAWTVLTQIAADTLEVPIERVHVEIGDTALPKAIVAGASWGTTSWGTAIVDACRKLHERVKNEFGGQIPATGCEATGEGGTNPHAERFAMHAFGAQFAEVRVNRDSGEVRVPRLLGVFAAGHIMNAKTARSQFIGGMVMGISTTLHEHSVIDHHFGDYVNHDLAEYHIAANADVRDIEAVWIDEDDPYVNPMGAKGIGEIGIVGTAAAIANAVYHATGIRIRELPITLDKLLGV